MVSLHFFVLFHITSSGEVALSIKHNTLTTSREQPQHFCLNIIQFFFFLPSLHEAFAPLANKLASENKNGNNSVQERTFS